MVSRHMAIDTCCPWVLCHQCAESGRKEACVVKYELTLPHHSHARLSVSGRALLGVHGYMNWQMWGCRTELVECVCVYGACFFAGLMKAHALLACPTGAGSQR